MRPEERKKEGSEGVNVDQDEGVEKILGNNFLKEKNISRFFCFENHSEV